MGGCDFWKYFANSLALLVFRRYTTRMKIEIEITVKEIETGLFVASYQGKEVSHGRTSHQAVERAEEFCREVLAEALLYV